LVCYNLREQQASIPLIDSIAEFVSSSGLYMVTIIGNPAVRIKLHEDLRSKRAQFANVIHPPTIVAEEVRLGVGVVLAPFPILSVNSCIGAGVVINDYIFIQHDAQVGSCIYISGHYNVGDVLVLGQEAVV